MVTIKGARHGHWIATRAADIEYIQKNRDPFSMQRIVLPDHPDRPRLVPIEMDPPVHGKYRRILNEFGAVSRMRTALHLAH